MKAQLSAEMLIILVVILGLAVLVASVMLKSGKQAADSIEQKTEQVIAASEDTMVKGESGDYCVNDADCESGSCDTYSKKCY